MRRSLRLRMTASLLVVLMLALGMLSVVVHQVVAHALTKQLDAQLSDDASAVAGMAEDEGAAIEFEYESLPDFERPLRPAYFEAWLDDGTVLARSPSLQGRELPRPSPNGPAFDVTLPDGRPGRSVALRQPLRIEEAGPGRPRQSGRYVTVAVAQGTEGLRASLGAVRRWLALWASVTMAAASLAVVLSVSRGLRAARDLAARVAQIDAARPGPLLPTADLPDELAPLAQKLNQLLARIEESFARERRFTADVSHELRTPLAALRTTIEVALRRPREPHEYAAAIAEMGGVVGQMQALCENLLALARLDAGIVPVRSEPVALRALVDECWRPFRAVAEERSLTFANELSPAAVVTTDRDHLRIIVSNLLSNAASYTACGGAIVVRAGATSLLQVDDSGPGIPPQVLPHLFERFVRGDVARSAGVHCGIGLALARGLGTILRLAISAENTPDGGVSFQVRPADAVTGALV
jgi:two-component system sensor histidine kinase QseC